MAKVDSEDNIKEFIPQKPCKMVILGTMASINARDIPGLKKHKDAFFYNDQRNLFWKILQLSLDPFAELKVLESKKQRQDFLSKNGIAMGNIVQSFKVEERLKAIPDDKLIFDAFLRDEVSFKKLKPKFKNLLKTCPVFFTCAHNRTILKMVQSYFDQNQLGLVAKQKVHFLLTPTRCNPLERSLGWKIRMKKAGVNTKNIQIPKDF